MMSADSQNVPELLRQVNYPSFSREIVASGFIGGVVAIGRKVEVEFKPDTRDEDKVARMEHEIRSVLSTAEY